MIFYDDGDNVEGNHDDDDDDIYNDNDDPYLS